MGKWLLVAALPMLISAAPSREISLFNGKDFTGWTFFQEEKDYNVGGKGRISNFATIRPGGVIEITSNLHGALMTKQDYLNYQLHAEWRWVDPKARNNSGLFLRIRPPYVWDAVHGETSREYMVQIEPPNSGDLWVLGYSESALKTVPERSYKPFGNLELTKGGHIRRHLASKNAERPAGEWNSTDITINGKTIRVEINGELVNEGSNLVDLPGRIGLETEFGTIQYRNLRLTPID